MKTAGLIGGTSWHSTVEYYKYINKMVSERIGPPPTNPPLLIYSLCIELMRRGDWEEIKQAYLEIALKLQSAGAEAVVICANTPHKVFPFVQPKIKIPIIHIADAIGEEAMKHGMNKLGLLGTLPVMEGNYIGVHLSEKYGIEVCTPSREHRYNTHKLIVKELVNGQFKEEIKSYFLEVIKSLESDGVDGVILGCTELPILLDGLDSDLPFLNTTKVHSKKVVDFILS